MSEAAARYFCLSGYIFIHRADCGSIARWPRLFPFAGMAVRITVFKAELIRHPAIELEAVNCCDAVIRDVHATTFVPKGGHLMHFISLLLKKKVPYTVHFDEREKSAD